MKDEALKLALEALEYYDKPRDEYSAKVAREQDKKAITAIKQALAAPVQEPVGSMGMPLSCGKPLCAPGDHHPLCKLATPPAQPAQPQRTEQEPETFEQWNAKQHGDPEEIGFLQALRIAYIAGQDSMTTLPAQPAPVQSCYCPNCEAIGKELAALKAQPAPVQDGWKLVPSVPTNEWVSNLAKMQTGSLEEVSFVEIHQCIAELLAAAPEKGQP